MIDIKKCLECLQIAHENYGNMRLHPCLKCIDEEKKEMSENIVCVSGFFDPLHVGHLAYFEEAAKYGRLIVILNSDEAAKRKKGYVFMPFSERKTLIEALKCVDRVESVDDSDGTVCKALARIRPTYFAKGGDRGPGNTPEQEACGHLGIEMLWGMGGDHKAQSSSRMVAESWDSLLGNLG